MHHLPSIFREHFPAIGCKEYCQDLAPAVVNALGSISSYNASFYETGTLNHKATLNLGVTD